MVASGVELDVWVGNFEEVSFSVNLSTLFNVYSNFQAGGFKKH